MPALSSVLLVFQGLPISLFGATILIDASKAGFGDVPASVSHVIGFANLSLGTSYLLTSLGPRRTRHNFLLGTIPLRILAAYVFTTDGADARGAPMWDYVNACISAGIVGWESGAFGLMIKS